MKPWAQEHALHYPTLINIEKGHRSSAPSGLMTRLLAACGYVVTPFRFSVASGSDHVFCFESEAAVETFKRELARCRILVTAASAS